MMVKRETAVGTEGLSSQELAREGPCETCAPGSQEVFPSHSHHSPLYPLKVPGVFSTVTKEGRKDRGSRGFACLWQLPEQLCKDEIRMERAKMSPKL